MHLSPAALTDRIQRLEEDLGAPLFARTTRRVALTDAGARLLPKAREILSAVEQLALAATGSRERPAYELFLGTRYELGMSWLCPALTPLEKAHPERTIHLWNADTPDLLLRLERGDLDAVVTSARLTARRLSYAALHEERYVFVSRRRVLRRREDAESLVLADVSPDVPLFRYLLDALPAADPWRFSRVEYLGGIGNIRCRVLESARHVAVLPRYFVQPDLDARRLVALMPRHSLRSDTFRLVWRTGHPRTSELLELAAELRHFPLR